MKDASQENEIISRWRAGQAQLWEESNFLSVHSCRFPAPGMMKMALIRGCNNDGRGGCRVGGRRTLEPLRSFRSPTSDIHGGHSAARRPSTVPVTPEATAAGIG